MYVRTFISHTIDVPCMLIRMYICTWCVLNWVLVSLSILGHLNSVHTVTNDMCHEMTVEPTHFKMEKCTCHNPLLLCTSAISHWHPWPKTTLVYSKVVQLHSSPSTWTTSSTNPSHRQTFTDMDSGPVSSSKTRVAFNLALCMCNWAHYRWYNKWLCAQCKFTQDVYVHLWVWYLCNAHNTIEAHSLSVAESCIFQMTMFKSHYILEPSICHANVCYTLSLTNLKRGWPGCWHMQANCAAAESTRDSQSMKASSPHLGTGIQTFTECALKVKYVS